MKSAHEILKDLGFNPQSDSDVQKAFLRHLVRAAYGDQAEQVTAPIEQGPQLKLFDDTQVVHSPRAKRKVRAAA
jgi:hypothetical protein